MSKQATAPGGPLTARPCGHHSPVGRCGATPARLYLPGWRCAAHTPAALAGRPEPGDVRRAPPASAPGPARAGNRVRVGGGWPQGRVPAGAIYVGRAAPGLRASPYANPYPVRGRGLDEALRLYREHLAARPGLVRRARAELAGRDLACWCPLDQPCHADLLLTIASTPAQEPQKAPAGLTVQEAALGYIERGWPVFVLGRSKRPVANCRACKTAGPGHDPAACDCLTCHGFYAATLDPARLAAMLAAVPGGLLAIRTGPASGLLVVDIDPRNGGQVDRELMPPTATVATGGGGWHLYYRHPGGPAAAALAGHPGVDLKGEGGYVTAPPSIHPDTGRAYRWARREEPAEMPPALAAAVVPPVPAVPPPPGPARHTAGAGGISSPAALLAAHLAAVERAPEGRRRVTLYGAARGVWRMIAAGALAEADGRAALTAAGLAAQQTPREVRAAIDGGFTDEAAAA